MRVRPLRDDLIKYLKKRGLARKFEKQRGLFEMDQNYPSLNTELLEPRSLKLYSFRIDRKYRAVFIVTGDGEVEVVDINDHYQ
ncbi:MAG TPA: hypothetical protein VJ327_09740 [Patescibacteria group bacterium]|uniref:Toxin YoeB n=1 Tax=Candidatus Amesbacteria bacterium RIFCSPLOWO2_01_FULL_48_25 TaxID=1797259 RepID=A0A1F4ZFW4_9BACT|nr:MAG: hypothetical protein A2989_04850 [Candidatus Amesbacteria bacterium RIFCSPLOWO2_01_FULL_48_25]HJZ06107.1 hypothetical protein [Patescibacteria group bacterium]